MKQLRNNVIRAGLDALYYTGAHHVLRPLLAGVGTIFMLHHVRPARDDMFQPNRHLEITPGFLREVLTHVRSLGVDIVSMDEAHRRMSERDFARRFACFTFDDGYRDNRDYALPVMREFRAPLTVYVASDFAEGTGRLWWVALERVIARTNAIEITRDGAVQTIDAADAAAKQRAFAQIHDWLRTLPNDGEVQRAVSDLCVRHGVDDAAIARELCMSWGELRSFAGDPLVTIGAHTISHCNLSRESDINAACEMRISRERIESHLQKSARHFAYPYGDRTAAAAREFAMARELGFSTAVTTRPGMVFTENAEHLTALPRISLNGNYQNARFLSVLTSGAATAMWNGFRRVDAA
ncbi:polysaccharide deacetylase family protein [Afipia clevelandensis]|nr:polysaccharide deacetylase family protein [Afipia clevelandensis]